MFYIQAAMINFFEMILSMRCEQSSLLGGRELARGNGGAVADILKAVGRTTYLKSSY